MKQELLDLIPDLKERKARGENIQKYLESIGYLQGSPEVIELSYDIQAGDDYEIYLKDEEFAYNFVNEIFENLIALKLDDDIDSILDCGTGEGTTLIPFLDKWDELIYIVPEKIFACDISRKRLEVMRDKFKKYEINLIKADARDLPFLDNSFDMVTTFHSIEPNFADCERILKEVIRVAKKYILLVEPIYEWANDEQKKRMDEFKYFRGLPEFLKNNTSVETLLTHPMEHNVNPLNKGHLILLKKK